MRSFLRCVISGVLTAILPVLAQQSPSCYTTTTIVFGDPHSILSSLLMVSNTTIPSSTPTSTPASLLASIPSFTSPTASLASPVVTGLFCIAVNVPSPVRLQARDIEYVSFSGNDGVLISDPTHATLFQLIYGYLKTSTGLYVGASTDDEYTQLEASNIPPPVAQGWTVNSDGSISLNESAYFCSTPEDALYIVFNQPPPFDCAIAKPMAVAEPTSSASSSSSISLSQGTTPISPIGVTMLTSSLPIAPTSSALSSTSTFEGSFIAPLPLTSITSSIAVAPSSSVILAASGTSPTAVSTPLSPIMSNSSTSPSRPVSSTSSSSVQAVVSNPTNIVGPGQLSTQVSSIFSLPIVVSSISSSTMPKSSLSGSPTTSSSSSSISSSRASSSGVVSSSTAATSITGASSGVISTARSSSSFTSSTLTTTLASSSTHTISSFSSTSFVPSLASPYQRNTGKRGLAYTNVTLTQLFSLQGQNSQVSWAYDYYSLPNASNNVGPVNLALTFIPLLYNDADSLTSIWAANVQYSIANYGTDALFSFNEPDACNNGQSACMSVNASVTTYKSFMQPFAGQVLLGAPSVTNGGPPASLTYLSYFLGNCTGCTIDFINLHWYSSPYSFSYLTSYVRQAYAVGGNRPIYITEFGMDSIYYAEADVATFLKNATTWLDAQSYVMRYSWFGDFAQSGPSYEQGFGYLVNASGNALSNEGVVWNNYTGGYVPCPLTSGC